MSDIFRLIFICLGFHCVYSFNCDIKDDATTKGWSPLKRFCCQHPGCVRRLAPAVGSIRAVFVKPDGCSLQPSFDPIIEFYMVDCPEQAEKIQVSAESIYPLLGKGGQPLEGPQVVEVKPGGADLITIQACTDARGFGCRRYKLDVHRQGSSEALLSQLLVTSGGSDIALSPPFDPSVSLYRVDIPFSSSSTNVIAVAYKGGFVSFESFKSAEFHSRSLDVIVPAKSNPWGSEEVPSNWSALTSVRIFVVSADWKGELRYVLQFGRAPNADASLASMASNVGGPYPVGDPEQRRYMLEVPLGTQQVAVSATATDKDGARVTLGDNTGQGYASAVVKVEPKAPYKVMKIRIQAADQVTKRSYLLVIAMSHHSSWAMLSDLVVPGCEAGLLPPFQVDVFHYRCLLNNDAEKLKVIPKVMWMPGFNEQMQIRIEEKVWKSGHVFMQQLSDSGKAEVDVVVVASDGAHRATYHISAQGSQLASRGHQLFTTLAPSPRQPPTPMPPKRKARKESTESTTTSTTATELQTTRAQPSWQPPKMPKLPKMPQMPKIRLHLAGPNTWPSTQELAHWTGVMCAGASVVALLQHHDAMSFMFLLKELQFMGISSELAGSDSVYALITRPFRIFLLQVDFPLDVCRSTEQGCESLEGQEKKVVTTVVLWFLLSPPLLFLLLLGWWEATSEESLARRGLLAGIGLRGLRWKLLPVVLVIFDIGLFGFADAASKLLLQLDGDDLEVEMQRWHFQLSFSMLQWLYAAYPLGFCLFATIQLARLWQRLLVWSPTLECFADAKVLGVTLRGSQYPRPPAHPWAAVAEACDGLTELRAAVPICGAEGEILQLGGPPSRQRRAAGCLFPILSPEEAASAREAKFRPRAVREAQRALLNEFGSSSFRGSWHAVGPSRKLLTDGGSSATASWQLEREHLGLLTWMERRSGAYDALKVQIKEASGHGVITDSQGWPIYDCQGLPLRDLYQYCCYQFPWRPWLVDDGRTPCCCPLRVHEAYSKGVGVLAPWVPGMEGMQELEKQQINDWLSEWLVEAEAASAAREELRQLRWYSQELQPSVLREMALAVLEHREFRAVSGTPREALQAQARLDEFPPGPWTQQVDGLGSHEILAFVHEELMDTAMAAMQMPFYDEELVPDFLDASFGVVRFYIRSLGENPMHSGEQQDGFPKKRALRAPMGDSLSPRRPPALRVAHHVQLPQVRNNLVTLQLPLKHLNLMVSWLPAFGFAVSASSLALPVAERWQPLFWSSGWCNRCRQRPSAQSQLAPSQRVRAAQETTQTPGIVTFFLDVFERVLLVAACWCHQLWSIETDSFRPAAVLFLWLLLCSLLRLHCSGWSLLGSSSVMRSETLGRGEPAYGLEPLPKGLPLLQVSLSCCLLLNATTKHHHGPFFEGLSCFLVLWTGLFRILAVARVLVWSILRNLSKSFKKTAGLHGWQGFFSSCEWHKDCTLYVLNISASSDEPDPEFGIFQVIDGMEDGSALPLSLVCELLGLVLHGSQSLELGGPHAEGPSSNERRLCGLRKRLVVFEACPPGLTDVAEASTLLVQMKRYKGDVQNVMPLAVTRTQLVAAEEVPQLVATIQVVNHPTDPQRCRVENDSILSLYMPWGLDSRKPASTCHPGHPKGHLASGSPESWKDWRNETTDSPALINAWKSQVSSWLDDELAAGLVDHGILDLMFFAGNPHRGAFKEEVDKLLTPGIFTDECLGQHRFCESRCCREGRVLHYVISAKDLRPYRAWRPDPLGAQPASLFLAAGTGTSTAESGSSFGEAVNYWRPCMLRLSSRHVTYLLRAADDLDLPWSHPETQDLGDVREYRIPFVSLDRMEVSLGLRGHEDDECLLTLHGLSSTPPRINPQQGEVTSPFEVTSEPEMAASSSSFQHPLTMTPQPLASSWEHRSGKSALHSHHSPLPLVFRVSKADGLIWAKVIEEYKMFTPPLNILHYIGDVADHPQLPGLVFRKSLDGDQLWPDGTRYIGAWQEHTYHGHGRLLDADGQLIYQGQWSQGMKHGEGLYHFWQEPSGSHVYSGQFCCEEFSGRGNLWVAEEDGSLDWMRKNRPWAIIRYEGYFSGGSTGLQPRSLLSLDQRHAATVQEYFPLLNPVEGAGVRDGMGPHQGPGKPPRDHAAEMYGLDGADLQHCGPDDEAVICYADGTRYLGSCLAGAVPDGYGKLWEGEGLCFEGHFEGGLRALTGKVTLRNGVIYEGEFSRDGRRHGHGHTDIPEILQQRLGFQRHVGEYRDGLRDGPGEMLFADGTLYRGNFEKNRRHGHGHYRNSDGTPIFTGPWKNDEPGTGNADILYPTGHRYKGQVCDGCRDGKGSLWHENPDGSTFIYTGQWEADEMHGKGELHCSDGVYRGQFMNGVREGKGRFEYLRESASYEGSWEEDQPHGVGTFVDEQAEYADREFHLGELASMGRFVRRSRSIFKVKAFGAAAKPKVKVEEGPHRNLPHAGTVCQNAGLLPSEEPHQTRQLDYGSGFAHARSRPAHLGPSGALGFRWA